MDGYAVLWEYEVRDGVESEFLEHYGPDGSWAALFGKAAGYRGTLLMQDSDRPRSYLTLDRWESEQAYRWFRSRFAAEYEALDRTCQRLTERETARGSFRERRSGA